AEHIRASAFAHSETVLMLAWVLGGATGLIPFSPRIGIAVATVVLVLSAVRGVVGAVALRDEKLTGVASGEVPPVPPEPATKPLPARPRRRRARPDRRSWTLAPPAGGASVQDPRAGRPAAACRDRCRG